MVILKNRKRYFKRAGVMVLAFVMTISMLFPFGMTEVNAGNRIDVKPPSEGYFVSKTDILSSDFNSKYNWNDGTYNKKVYFGESGKEWLIAGAEKIYQNGRTSDTNTSGSTDTLVLFCNPDNSNYGTTNFLNSEATSTDYEGSLLDVSINNICNGFTSAEKSKMETVEIDYPENYSDVMGKQCSIKRKMYAASAYFTETTYNKINDSLICVGAGKGQFYINVKTKLKSTGWNEYMQLKFWLRTAIYSASENNLQFHEASQNSGVVNNNSKNPWNGTPNIVPALNLDISSLSFISSAPKANGKKTVALNATDTMTMRFDGSNKIKSQVAVNKNDNKISVTKDNSDDNLYLCVQYSDNGTNYVVYEPISQTKDIQKNSIGIDGDLSNSNFPHQ